MYDVRSTMQLHLREHLIVYKRRTCVLVYDIYQLPGHNQFPSKAHYFPLLRRLSFPPNKKSDTRLAKNNFSCVITQE